MVRTPYFQNLVMVVKRELLLREGRRQEDMRRGRVLSCWVTLDNRMTTDQRAGSAAVILAGCRSGAGQGSQWGKSQEAMWLGTAPCAPTPTGRGEAESLSRQVRKAVPKAGVGQVTLSAT